jgi:hypothetical protein
MRRLTLSLLLLMATCPELCAQSLSDQNVLGSDFLFVQRVREALIGAAIAISSDGLSSPAVNQKRHVQVQAVMNNPEVWKQLFAWSVSAQPAVINQATVTGTVVLKPMICTGIPTGCVETGNVDTQQALVTDAVINNAVASVFNAFFGGQ